MYGLRASTPLLVGRWQGCRSSTTFSVRTWLLQFQETKTLDLTSLPPDHFDEDELLSTLSNMEEGVKLAMNLRSDVLAASRKSATRNTTSKKLDSSLRIWLGAVFCTDTTVLERVTFEASSGQTLEKVATGDAVLQKVRSIRELKRRLDNGRRCYGLFHSSLPADPLAFVHVALTPELAPSLRYLTSHANEQNEPSHAMFYSVNSPHESLSGLDLATKVFKGAASQIRLDFPSIRVLSTLSPIPGFMSWLSKSPVVALPLLHRAVLQHASNMAATVSDEELLKWVHTNMANIAEERQLMSELQAPLTWLCGHYLANNKTRGNLPLDPVARFHLRNGASLHRINWMGNSSSHGIKTSAGFMCNYLYDLDSLEQRAHRFKRIETQGQFHMSEAVRHLLLA